MNNNYPWTFTKALILCTITAVGIAIILASDSGSNEQNPPPSSENRGSFNLFYAYAYDQTGDNVGGAQTESTISLIWAGERQLSSGEIAEANDTFNTNTNWTGISTNPWETSTIVPNLKPGNWNLSVNVNGQALSCQSPITLAADNTVKVTFLVSSENGVFTGCEQ